MKKIYLCGPIQFADDAVSWRKKASYKLKKYFEILDPLRRNFRDNEIYSTNEIVKFDLQDIEDADIVLVNYCKSSIGTSMEVREAYNRGKFIVAFTDLKEKDWSPWMIYHCTRILKDFDKAVAYIKEHWRVEDNENESA